jgi:peroxisomal leader peptide-processing protease
MELIFQLNIGLCSSLSSGVVSKVVQIPSTQLSHLSGTVEADNMDMPVMLQTTAAVHPGASGGVLVNSHGLMVGIITRYIIRPLRHYFRK